MEKKIVLSLNKLMNCAGERNQEIDGQIKLSLNKDQGGILLDHLYGESGGNPWRNAKYFAIDIRNCQMTEEQFLIEFWEKGNQTDTPDSVFWNKLMPLVEARILFETARLDSQLHFLPLTPGSLKSGISGNGMDVQNIDRIFIGFGKGHETTREFTLRNAVLSDRYPEFPEASEPNTDSLGQWTKKVWPGKTESESQLSEKLNKELEAGNLSDYPGNWDRYGGCRDIRLTEETGFFHTTFQHDRWWLVDPLGNAFFSLGIFGVYPGEAGWIHGNEGYLSWLPEKEGNFAPAWSKCMDSELFRRKFEGLFPDDTPLFSYATANLIRTFGNDWYTKWSGLTQKRLHAYGINTLSMFSDPRFIADSDLPFVVMLNHYPTTGSTIFREFPDVYSPEYSGKCKVFARQLEVYAGNRNLIGYFLNNEPTWGFVRDLNLAEKLLESDEKTYSKAALVDFLRERYRNEINSLNTAWNLKLPDFDSLYLPIRHAAGLSASAKKDLEDFTLEMILRYARIPSEYTREVLPNHLNLGMRFAGISSEALLQTYRFFDVFSLNCYSVNPAPAIDRFASRINKPILIGEFHFGSLDRGLPAPGLVAVASQEERGRAYARYVDRFARSPYAVGAHYFAYNDQPLWGRYDGENYQIGFVDICNMPYPEFVAHVAETNRTIYDLILSKRGMYPGNTTRL